jgi:hypothetical protein
LSFLLSAEPRTSFNDLELLQREYGLFLAQRPSGCNAQYIVDRLDWNATKTRRTFPIDWTPEESYSTRHSGLIPQSSSGIGRLMKVG